MVLNCWTADGADCQRCALSYCIRRVELPYTFKAFLLQPVHLTIRKRLWFQCSREMGPPYKIIETLVPNSRDISGHFWVRGTYKGTYWAFLHSPSPSPSPSSSPSPIHVELELTGRRMIVIHPHRHNMGWGGAEITAPIHFVWKIIWMV
jgi:hypothetical protein